MPLGSHDSVGPSINDADSLGDLWRVLVWNIFVFWFILRALVLVVALISAGACRAAAPWGGIRGALSTCMSPWEASTMVPGSRWKIFGSFLKLFTCFLSIYLSFPFTTSATVLQCQTHISQPPAPLTLFTLKLRIKTTCGLSLAPGSRNNRPSQLRLPQPSHGFCPVISKCLIFRSFIQF